MKLFLMIIFSVITLAANGVEEYTFLNDSERILWILLSCTSILALLVSSFQMIKLKDEYTKMQKKQDAITKTQDTIVSQMSENIYTIVQEAVSTESLLSQKIENDPTDNDLLEVMNSEKKLLDMTSNLIDFLKLKSKKIEISNDDFTFSNLLNDVSGGLISDFKNSNIELVYDIESDIPYILIGDTLHLGNIITSLLEYCMKNRARKITMKVSKVKDLSISKKLNFTISTDIKVDVDDTIFNYSYNEDTNEYEGLSLYIAKDLSLLMDGELVAKNTKTKNIELSLTIPFHSKKDTEDKYKRRLNKRLAKKRVLIVDDNTSSALALEKIFLNFKYSVKVETREEYLRNLYDFSMYDIVILDERLFTTKAIKSLKEARCNVVALGSFFSSSEINIDDLDIIHMKKPFTQERIYHALCDMFIPDAKKDISKEIKYVGNAKPLNVHRNIFADTLGITLDSFYEFRSKKILLVEDNLINQKVIISILGKSSIDIRVANNGKEGINFINAEDFDLVLMDINMPVMDGYTATQIIRENPDFNDLPIISLSALTSRDEISQMFNSGMNGYIAKPLKKEKLFTAFKIFMDGNSSETLKVSEVKSKEVEYEGLNVSSGVKHADGNSILYKELLLEFKDAYGKSDEILKTLLEDHRFEQAKMLCLDLKGLSGSISADKMYNIVTDMHKQLVYKKYDLLNEYRIEYSKELKKLNNSIRLYTS